ncbi:hypothetical protein BH24ACT26_BH24ACT26_08100 [soil metagenome]
MRYVNEGRVATHIEAARDLFERTKGRKLSEADTKAFFIEPLLRALGWPTDDPSQIIREYRVYDGTLLDYALYDQGIERPAIFLEAKALRKTLDDPTFIAQAINYANNEGVKWCVLTNGRHYRIYRTVEPVPMERKMLVEVDLLDEDLEPRELAKGLSAISQEFICSGQLEEWGQSVFTDVKVREALTALYSDPSPAFINAIHKALPNESNLSRSDVTVSLKRLGQPLGVTKPTPRKTPPATGQEKKSKTVSPWTLDHHLDDKPTQVRDLYDRFNAEVIGLGEDVKRTFSKFYIAYSVKKSFATVQATKGLLKIWISISPEDVSGLDHNVFRDVSKIGHHGMGDVEARLSDASQLGDIMPLVKLSYERRR